jgi:hypothetical protein
MHVADILKVKGTRVVTISSAASIELVAQRLRMERVGALVVSETGATVDGIVMLPTGLQNIVVTF